MRDIPPAFGKPRAPAAPSPRQQVKRKLRAREAVLGINPEFASPGLVEFCCKLGAELIFIDCEQGGPDMQTVADMVRAAHAEGAAAVLRPWSMDAGVLRRYLATGLDGFIVPDAETAGQFTALQSVVTALDPPDAANLLLIALVESELGQRNLGAMFATGLVDAVLVGSGDLAVSMGLPRRGDHAAVRAVTFDIVAQARAAGVSAGAPLVRYGVKPTVDAGGNLVMFFAKDILRDGLDAGLQSLRQP